MHSCPMGTLHPLDFVSTPGVRGDHTTHLLVAAPFVGLILWLIARLAQRAFRTVRNTSPFASSVPQLGCRESTLVYEVSSTFVPHLPLTSPLFRPPGSKFQLCAHLRHHCGSSFGTQQPFPHPRTSFGGERFRIVTTWTRSTPGNSEEPHTVLHAG
ncbi:hypothetical protein EDB84DRAFT_236042 [Lactarius hengduanensis]|nr:hypothetical protein EDB84DRAFT_236042 [Lactarius hengduanensis]